MLVKLLTGPHLATCSFCIEQPDDSFHLEGFSGQIAARALSRRIVHVPSFSNQTKEPSAIPEDSLDRTVSQMM